MIPPLPETAPDCILMTDPTTPLSPEVEKAMGDLANNEPVSPETHDLGSLVCKAEGCSLALGDYLDAHGRLMVAGTTTTEEARERLADLATRVPANCSLQILFGPGSDLLES